MWCGVEAVAKAPSWTAAHKIREATPPTAKQQLCDHCPLPPGPGLVRGQEEIITEQSCQEVVATPVDNYPDKLHRYCVTTVINSFYNAVMEGTGPRV